MLLWSFLAVADPSFTIPVSGSLTDSTGSPLDGARVVRFSLRDPSGEIWAETRMVAFHQGAFTAALGDDLEVLTLADLPPTTLDLVVRVDGVDSAPVAVGWAPRAARAWEADRLGGIAASGFVRGDYAAGHGPGQVPISDGTLNATLNADLVDGLSTGNGAGQLPVSNGVTNVGLDADTVDGRHAGTAAGQIAVNTGALNASLNADQVDGMDASAFVQRVDLGTSLGGLATSGANLLNVSATWLTGQIDARLQALGLNTTSSAPTRLAAANARFDKLAVFIPQVNDYVNPVPFKRTLWTAPYVKIVNVANNAGPNFPSPSVLSVVEWDWAGDEVWNYSLPPSGYNTVWARITLSMRGSNNHSPCIWLRREYVPSSGAAFTKMSGDPDIYVGCTNLSMRTKAPASVEIWAPWWKTNLTRASGFGGDNQRLLISVETDYDPDAAGGATYYVYGGMIELFASDTGASQTFSTGSASGAPLADSRQTTLP